MEKFRTELTDHLFRAVLSLESIDECYKFFEDVCTIKEIQEIAQRLEVARLLKEGKPYNDVAKETGASTATISRVNKCISYGSGGYSIVLERLSNESDSK